MSKLIMCIGLPGSGKSTWAKMCEAGVSDYPFAVRVNKDDIRVAMGMNRKNFTREQEYSVIDRRDQMIIDGLKAGKTVISDDTNFGKKHEPRLRELARQFNAEFVVKSFVDVPVEVCIQRDSQREITAQVGKDVIWGMAETHLGIKRLQPVVHYFNDPTLRSAVLCDLDGTLCLHNGRNPYDYDNCDTDLVNEPIQYLLDIMSHHADIIFLSGREDTAREKTEVWLANHGWKGRPLYMRPAGDYRKDSIVKRELFDANVAGNYYIEFVLDDRDQVVKTWREMGLCCLQVAYGAF